MAAIPKNLRHLLLHGNGNKGKPEEKESDVELVEVTGLEFKQFVKGADDAVDIVCQCFEPMVYTGQHNYKNMNYYVLECPTCKCINAMRTIPYINNSHYAVDPAFMRKDHEEKEVIGYTAQHISGGATLKQTTFVAKLVFKHSSEPIYRIVDRNGHTESIQLTGTELLAYYKKQEIQRKSGVIEPLIWENVIKTE